MKLTASFSPLLSLLFIGLVLLASPATAQTKVNLGLRGGLGMSNMNVSYESTRALLSAKTQSDESRIVPNIGLLLELDFDNSPFSLLFGLGYRQRGFKVHELSFVPEYLASPPVDPQPYNIKTRLDYLSFDASMRYYLLRDTQVKPYVGGGLRFDSKIGSDVSKGDNSDGANADEAKRQWGNTMRSLNTSVLGAVVQAGLTIKRDYFVEFEYNPDLTRSFNNVSYDGGAYAQTGRSQVFSLSFGWNFGRY